MARFLTILFLLSAMDFSAAQDVPGQLAARKEKWQEYLENRKFSFLKDERGLITSMRYFSATCEFRTVINSPPKHSTHPKRRMFFKFIREGKEVLTLPGHYESVFRTTEEKLYIANFSPIDPGCSVSAYNLNSGKEFWTTKKVDRLKQGGASGYHNQVLLRLSRRNEVSNEPEAAAILVTGNEGFGHYIAILDRKTGAILAHRIYGTSFWQRRELETQPSKAGGGGF